MSFQYDFVWAQYLTFPLDEIHFLLISNVVIFDHEQYKSCFFQDHLTFLNVRDFFVWSHSKYQNLYQVLYHSSDVK